MATLTATSTRAARDGRDPLRATARTLRDSVGHLTAGHRALPGLLITGGQRCGTTSLYKALSQQPHLHRPVWRKGVHFFDSSYDKGVDWYRSHFPLVSTVRRSSERWGTPATCFESSPYYLFHPLAAERIHETLPQVRVVILVRDPIERAISAHAHELARGYETLPLAEALAAEDARVAGEEERLAEDPTYTSHAHQHQAYRRRGEYVTQIEKLASVLGRDHVYVMDSHRFFEQPADVFVDFLGWMGTRAVVPTMFEQHNARKKSTIDPGLRAELEQHYAPFDEALTPWLGAPASWRS
ncbi:sulfotransferase domain-containing protein [Nocardioides sp. GY 10127]|uniref:sulfotransferase domain-containing protein n=1 Tax=Nocardioides sp. GY 10127 TaxID=2569762 RepID=UPI0010A8CC8C|nr:sulfotransferase domain-containing protein [Nocardioides sp. GY 10127]TIC81859.1 sulfotransferase domain-containing protein [Nocardioides sp. GY 10127]